MLIFKKCIYLTMFVVFLGKTDTQSSFAGPLHCNASSANTSNADMVPPFSPDVHVHGFRVVDVQLLVRRPLAQQMMT